MFYRRIKSTGLKSCTGCRMCEMICSMIHEESVINPSLSSIKIKENSSDGTYTPVVCQLCETAACLENCPQQAISRDNCSGAIIISNNLCNGCGFCVDSCKFDAIKIHEIKKIAFTCDLCNGKTECVKFCLQKALIFSK